MNIAAEKKIFFRLKFHIEFSVAGRCLIAVGSPRLAENFLQMSMKLFMHPDTVLLLGE
jgi:hypothetical protein